MRPLQKGFITYVFDCHSIPLIIIFNLAPRAGLFVSASADFRDSGSSELQVVGRLSWAFSKNYSDFLSKHAVKAHIDIPSSLIQKLSLSCIPNPRCGARHQFLKQ
jgi:hypothetical protein